MNSKLLVVTIRLAIVAGLLIVIAGGNTTKAQVEENLSFNFHKLVIDYSKGNRVEILINTPDSQKFLTDPINTLKRQGVAVPRAAEAPWRAFTGALRKLAPSHTAKAKGSRRPSKGVEIWTYKFDKIAVLGTIAGDGNGAGMTTAGAREASARFRDDPLATLQAGRVEVPAADERAWRQLAAALKELQGVYSGIRTKRNAEAQQAPSELNRRIDVEGTRAVAPRGWDPKKKIEVTGSSETSQEQVSAGDPDRPYILGRVYNNKGNAGIVSAQGSASHDGVVLLFASLPGGFTRGRTLRLTVVNPPGSRAPDGRKYKMLVAPLVLDLDGRPIAKMAETEILAGGSHSFDFNRDDISLTGEPGTGRIQVNAQVRYRFLAIVDRTRTTRNAPEQSTGPLTLAGQLQLFDANGKQITQSGEELIQPGEFHGFGLDRGHLRRAGTAGSDLQVRASFTLRTIHRDGNEQFQGSLAIVNNQTSKVEAQQGWLLIARQREISESGNQAVTGRVTGIGIDPGNSTAPVQGGFGNDQMGVIGQGNNVGSGKPTNQRPRAAQPDLVIKQFLFPPTNDKALRVQVSNDGSAASGANRLIITVRKINGTAVGRQTHVNIPALAPGKKVWLVIDAKSILPNNVALQSTTFKLNADGTEIVVESDETNNEVWHNL